MQNHEKMYQLISETLSTNTFSLNIVVKLQDKE